MNCKLTYPLGNRLIKLAGYLGFFSHLAYYYIWVYLIPQPFDSFYLRLSSSLVSVPLILIDYWPEQFKSWLPVYWHLFLMYVLTVTCTYLMLQNNFSTMWMMTEVMAIFTLATLIDELALLAINILLGALISTSLFLFQSPSANIAIDIASFALIPVILACSIMSNLTKKKGIEAIGKNKAMQSLAGSIAHEMRNPLSQIHGNLYLIEELRKQSPYDENPFVAEHIKNAQKAIHSGIQMIDMTMDAINEKPIDRSSFIILSAQAIVKETVKDYAYADADHINRITIEGDDFQLLADPIMVKYLLYNLIQNAFWYIKNSHGGKLVISIFSNTNGFHCIEVRDNGPGIAPEAIPKLFDPFYTTEKQGGTGLGLSYCKRTMTALGGKIDCHSTLGLYTAFVLSFPILGARQIDDCAEHKENTGSELLTGSIKETVTVATEPPAYLVGKTVLLVEDERTIRTAIKALLEQYGMHCVEAENGQEAMRLFSTIDCALLITDLHMPVMNGVDLIKAIRALEETANNDLGKAVPIIVITSEKGNLLSSAIQAGANTFLTKPVADDKLKSTLHRLYAKKYQA